MAIIGELAIVAGMPATVVAFQTNIGRGLQVPIRAKHLAQQAQGRATTHQSMPKMRRPGHKGGRKQFPLTPPTDGLMG